MIYFFIGGQHKARDNYNHLDIHFQFDNYKPFEVHINQNFLQNTNFKRHDVGGLNYV